ncbi:MAG: hypothetical protein D6753_02220 [Planctomycetota bacterium]|nr:MAG: hypothetical protein D6753_02220 [Planctomycetota bacterium]
MNQLMGSGKLALMAVAFAGAVAGSVAIARAQIDPPAREPLIDKTLLNDLPQDEGTAPRVGEAPADAGADQVRDPLLDRFERLLTGARLIGRFTVDGQPMDRLRQEVYEVKEVRKLPAGDLWVITARIKYGDHDLTVPVPLQVKWAGTTPVLTLDNLTIPGLGTFSARVVLHKDKYAGTWQHDDVGGHLFGKIEIAAGQDSGG